METLKKALSSRTVWTAIIVFVFNGLEATKDVLPPDWQVGVNAVLTMMTIFFKLNPSKKYNG